MTAVVVQRETEVIVRIVEGDHQGATEEAVETACEGPTLTLPPRGVHPVSVYIQEAPHQEEPTAELDFYLRQEEVARAVQPSL